MSPIRWHYSLVDSTTIRVAVPVPGEEKTTLPELSLNTRLKVTWKEFPSGLSVIVPSVVSRPNPLKLRLYICLWYVNAKVPVPVFFQAP